MGACDSVTNGFNRYSNQATIIFDYPLSFDWRHKGDSVANFLETFSEYGTSRESTKYMGARSRFDAIVLFLLTSYPLTKSSTVISKS